MQATRTRAEQSEMTLREAILAGIREEMREDDDVFVIGQDVRAFEGPLKSTEGLWREFGDDRVIETGISESSVTSVGVGAAVMGQRPIVEVMFSDLLPLVATPVIQLAANLRYMTDEAGSVPMVIRTRGGDGPYRAHPQNYEALFAHSPGLTIVAPSNPSDGYGLIRSAIRSDDPVLFIENIYLYNAFRQPVDIDEVSVPLGSAANVRDGRDLTIVTYGRSVRTSTVAATRLSNAGIEAAVVDLRTLSPLDDGAILDSVKTTGRLLVVHEAWRTGGIGAEVISRVVRGDAALRAAPGLIGAPDVPIPWAEPMRDAMLPTVDEIVRVCEQMMAGG